jgi:hypothetical protein
VIKKQENVIALAYHVDYWDYIGWKDPFATPVNTQRQRGYSKAMGLWSIYTPQMVIDGRLEGFGSRSRAGRRRKPVTFGSSRMTKSAPRRFHAVRMPAKG